MAQTNFTPISLYFSTTAAAAPTAGNLVNGELAINITDGKLYYKDNGGVVQTIASKDANSGTFVNLAYTGTLTGGTGIVNLGSGQFYKDASGNIGIGTASPSSLGGTTLQVQNNTVGAILWSDGTRTGELLASSTANISIGARSNHSLILVTNDTERMRIDTSGRVLIGSTSSVGNANANNLELTNPAGSGVCGLTLNVNSGSANTGNIYWRSNASNNAIQLVGDPITNYFAIATAGAEAMRINSSGNVGIGTGSPGNEAAAARLALVGTAAQDANSLATSNTKAVLSLRGDSNSGYSTSFGTLTTTDDQYIQGVNFSGGAVSCNLVLQPFGGNLGIGTGNTAPQQRLSIKAATNVPQLYLIQDNVANDGYKFFADSSSGYLSFLRTTSGSDTERMRIDVNGNVGIGTASPTYGTLEVAQGSAGVVSVINNTAGAWSFRKVRSDGSNGMGLYDATGFGVMALYAAGSERMRIDSSGNVGIGTSSPSKKLEVWATSNSLQILSVVRNDQAGSGVAAIGFNTASSGGGEATSTKAGIGLLRGASFGRGALCFYNNDTASAGDFTTADERMRITPTGNVGIGASSPADFGGTNLQIQSSSAATYASTLWASGTYTMEALINQNSAVMSFGSRSNHHFALVTNDTERMRIGTTGDVSIGSTSVIAEARLNVFQSDSSGRVVHFENTRNVSGDENLRTQLGDNCNNTSSYHYVATTGNDKLYIYGNGNIVNANNSYGALSDESIKENIVDATPKLDSLMGVKIRNFNLIDDDTKTKQIGVVAQELEEVFPSMVELDGMSGKKQVKYSVFIPMLIKAMQEQQALIENLTTRLNALEGK
jgi:hypothetical protein